MTKNSPKNFKHINHHISHNDAQDENQAQKSATRIMVVFYR